MHFTTEIGGIRAVFSEEELAMCRSIAKTRNSAKVAGVRSKKWTERHDELDLHEMGVKSELAVAEYIGCPKDSMMLVYHRGGDRGLPDLYTPGRTAISVKCRSRKDGDFVTEYQRSDEFADDIGVLCINAPDGVVIVGWFTVEEFIEHAFETDYGYGPRLAMHQEHMSRPESLRRLIEAEVDGE